MRGARSRRRACAGALHKSDSAHAVSRDAVEPPPANSRGHSPATSATEKVGPAAPPAGRLTSVGTGTPGARSGRRNTSKVVLAFENAVESVEKPRCPRLRCYGCSVRRRSAGARRRKEEENTEAEPLYWK